jgi:hypothetical protein
VAEFRRKAQELLALVFQYFSIVLLILVGLVSFDIAPLTVFFLSTFLHWRVTTILAILVVLVLTLIPLGIVLVRQRRAKVATGGSPTS